MSVYIWSFGTLPLLYTALLEDPWKFPPFSSSQGGPGIEYPRSEVPLGASITARETGLGRLRRIWNAQGACGCV
jgi:hypothetical protein